MTSCPNSRLEHECKIELEESLDGKFLVTQPGSSSATSLCAAEAVKKHVGIVEIRGNDIRLVPVPLQSQRPLIIEDIVLEEYSSVRFHHELIMDADCMSFRCFPIRWIRML